MISTGFGGLVLTLPAPVLMSQFQHTDDQNKKQSNTGKG